MTESADAVFWRIRVALPSSQQAGNRIALGSSVQFGIRTASGEDGPGAVFGCRGGLGEGRVAPRGAVCRDRREAGERRATLSGPRFSGFSAIVQQSTNALRGMSAKSFFIGLGAPSRPVRHHEITVHDLRQVGEKLVIPCQPVDIGFHDS